MKSCVKRMKPGVEVVLREPALAGQGLARCRYKGRWKVMWGWDYLFELLEKRENFPQIYVSEDSLERCLVRVGRTPQVNFQIDPESNQVTVRESALRRMWRYICR